jgi:hypothetical protein
MGEDFRRYLAKSNKGDLCATKLSFDVFPDDIFSNISGQKGINEVDESFNQLASRMNSLPGI